MSWNVSGLSSLPSVEDLLEQPPDNPPPPSVDKTVIEIEDSDNVLEEGEIGATLVEVGQDLLDLVTPGKKKTKCQDCTVLWSRSRLLWLEPEKTGGSTAQAQ